MHRDQKVDPAAIRRVALLTIEGEHDDISGVGQTEAAHRLCVNIPANKKAHWLQPGVGHYGVFNGSRFRSEIAPRISDFVLMSHRAIRDANIAVAFASGDARSERGGNLVELRRMCGNAASNYRAVCVARKFRV